jgi:hypothetical protein
MPYGRRTDWTSLLVEAIRDILKATIVSKEFKDIWKKTFQREVIVLENNEFWKYLFTLCCSLYAPMRILQLADQENSLNGQASLLCLSNG